ncbi:hypothetical protein [Alkalilimnicola sp. S0819]|uniref:hypothetical protein n=1 Tax=Alkalilimnicola sp. S0819 TaxID=2613922 RepID=UPI001261AD4A|nr:hypothetical protein [Alkalilimnicola sp. S0819]KAB7619549.1 hypothetical protein F3N43_13535 [Alkalilimnicola sp. S0819]MPQ17658.1 hypothetical protein [Alkalilimnicola sp. S0819]
MAAHRTSRLFVALLFSSLSCFANGDDSADVRVLRLAQEQLARAVISLEQQMERCDRQRVVLTPQTFQALSPSDEQLRVVLRYLHLRNANECIRPAAGSLALAENTLARVKAHSSNGKTAMGGKGAGSDLLPVGYMQELEAKAAYDELPEELRSSLAVPGVLERPIDPIGSARALGLLQKE